MCRVPLRAPVKGVTLGPDKNLGLNPQVTTCLLGSRTLEFFHLGTNLNLKSSRGFSQRRIRLLRLCFCSFAFSETHRAPRSEYKVSVVPVTPVLSLHPRFALEGPGERGHEDRHSVCAGSFCLWGVVYSHPSLPCGRQQRSGWAPLSPPARSQRSCFFKKGTLLNIAAATRLCRH